MPCAVENSGPSNAVDIFNVTSGTWSTAALSVARYYLAATSLPNVGVAIFAGGSVSSAVDIFNVTSGLWSTAALSVARYYFAATSLPNVGVAIFAGGQGTSCHVYFRIFACCVVRVGEWDG
jgi:predicted component of type VI protein secretion system